MAEPHWSSKRVWQGGESFRSQAVDFLVLLVLISAVSWFFDHHPRGWIGTNPSPFFLLPILMGGRYAQLTGLLSGLGAAAVLVGISAWQTGDPAGDVAASAKLVLICLPLVGVVCGEMQRFISLDVMRARIQLDQASRRMRALDEQVFILAETKDELDRDLALLNADTANMDFEIRRVLQSPPERFYEALLGVLCRKARLYEAAIYSANSSWHRAAFSGTPEAWPEHLEPGKSAVAASALKSGSIVTLPDVWADKPTSPDDFLVACPIGETDKPAALLVVRSMPFSSMNTRGMQIIETVCKWVSEFSGLQRRAVGFFDPRGFVSRQDFDRMLDLACEVQCRFQLISSVILIRPDPGVSADSEQIRAAVSGAVRIGDIVSHLDTEFPHILLLLPLTGLRGAEICRARILEHARTFSDGGLPLDGLIFCTTDYKNAPALQLALLASLRPS